MASIYLHRRIEKELAVAARQFPIVVLTGPRQTGKTTLLQRLFPRLAYVTLDDPAQRLSAKNDPGLFLERLGVPAMIDEIQHVPGILPFIKMAVDHHRDQMGQYLLTGSQIFPLMAGISESLAGRAALFELLGFSWRELRLDQERTAVRGCFDQIFKGFYPSPAMGRASPKNFYGGYLQTYLERDIRQIQAVHDMNVFQSFLELLAGRAGSLLNLHDISNSCAISHTTARRWLSLLETTRLVYLLRPYFRNVSKRVVKSPKLYFTDTGLLAYLLKYPDGQTLSAGPMAGVFFENMVVMEFLKKKFNENASFEFYFYRDSNGNETDLVIDLGRRLVVVEIKMAKALGSEHAQALDRVGDTLKADGRFLLSFYPGPLALMPSVKTLPWWRFQETLVE